MGNANYKHRTLGNRSILDKSLSLSHGIDKVVVSSDRATCFLASPRLLYEAMSWSNGSSQNKSKEWVMSRRFWLLILSMSISLYINQSIYLYLCLMGDVEKVPTPNPKFVNLSLYIYLSIYLSICLSLSMFSGKASFTHPRISGIFLKKNSDKIKAIFRNTKR